MKFENLFGIGKEEERKATEENIREDIEYRDTLIEEGETSVKFEIPDSEGRELLPGESALFSIPKKYTDRIVRDVVLKHRKSEKYRKDIGVDHYDPHGAYSRVELLSSESNGWIGWRDPKGYSSDKFAEPRPASDPENEVLHDWVATVGKVRPTKVRVTNVGKSQSYSISQIHGVEVIFFPNLEGVKYDEQIYTTGTQFADFEDEGPLVPRYGGGSHTEGVYERSVCLNMHRTPSFETTKTLQGGAVEGNRLILPIKSKEVVQLEVAIGDTEHLATISPKTGKHTRLGYAKLWLGVKNSKTGKIDYFVKNANVPPQGVIAGSLEPGSTKSGDELIIEVRDDTAYIMGWRVAYREN